MWPSDGNGKTDHLSRTAAGEGLIINVHEGFVLQNYDRLRVVAAGEGGHIKVDPCIACYYCFAECYRISE